MTEPALFIRLYLDEDVSVFLAQLLRPHGFEVLTTREGLVCLVFLFCLALLAER